MMVSESGSKPGLMSGRHGAGFPTNQVREDREAVPPHQFVER